MPQLDFATFPSQLFWLALCFMTTYICVRLWFIPRMERIAGVRARKIERSFEKAKQCQEQSLFLLADYEAILKEAKDEATEIFIDIHKKNQIERLNLEHEISTWIKEEMKVIETKLEKEREVSDEDLKEAVEEITKIISQKLESEKKSLDLDQILEKKVRHG
jgi:F-type H+-transporting ATPase subunit b